MAVLRVGEDLFSCFLDIEPRPLREGGNRLIALLSRRTPVHRKTIVAVIQMQGQIVDSFPRDVQHRLVPGLIGMSAGKNHNRRIRRFHRFDEG
ncbi:hypothetical protein D3C81_1923630 [compost metagenome]